MKEKNTSDATEIQRIKRDYEWLHDNKFDNLKEMDKFLQIYNPSRKHYEEIENMNGMIIEIESVIQNLPAKKNVQHQRIHWWILPKNLISILLKVLQIIK